MANDIDQDALAAHFAEQDKKANAVAGVSLAVKAGAQYSPQEWAKSSQLSLSTGVDPAALASNPLIRAAAENRLKGEALNAPDLVDSHPRVAQWMTDPVNAGITGENHGLLQSLSDAFDQLGASAFSGTLGLVAASAKLLQAGTEMIGVGTSDSEAATLYKNDPEGLKRFREESMAGGLSRFARKTQAFSTEAFALRDPSTKATYDPLKYATTDAGESALLSPVKVMGDVLRSLPTSVAMGATILFTRNVAIAAKANATTQAATLGLTGEAAGAFVAKAVTNAAAKAAAVSGASSEGAAGYATQALSTEEEAAKMDMSKSTRYAQLIKDGYAPEAAKAKVVADVAEQAGLIAGIADAAINAAAGRLLGGILTEAGGAVKAGAKTAALEGVTEMAQSPLEQLGTNIGLKEIDPSKGLADGLLESAIQGLAVGAASGGMMGGLHGLTNKGIAEDAQVKDATAGHNALTALSEAASKAAPVRDLDKGRFKEFMQSMVEDSQIQELYVDANALHDALAQAPIEAQQLFMQEMPEVVKQLGEGTATDGLVRIPVADYATHIAGTEVDAAILPHLKTDASGLTYSQVEQHMQEQQANMQQAADELVTKYSEDQAYQEDVKSVYDNILGQLETAKRFRPDVNKKYAELQKAYFVVAAEEEGVKPSEMLKRFPLKVVGGDTLGDTATTLEHSAVTDTPEFKNWFGDSKAVKEGNPITFYRGQPAYYNGKPLTNRYFTNDPAYAASYDSGEGGLNVVPVYIKTLNPRIEEDINRVTDWEYDREELLAQGYDAVVDAGWNVIVPLKEETQIKSAIGNQGTFDPNDPNILNQPSSGYGYRARDAARKATLEDFTPGKVKDLLRKTDWAILTAENPAAQQLTPEENAARMEELKADLAAQGIQFEVVEGKYGGNIENSVMLVGVTQAQASAIGQKFGQESVLTRVGLVYPDGTVNPAKKVNTYEKAPADFYTRVPSTGALFSVDIDFNQKLTPAGARVGEVEVTAVHFSNEARTSLSGRAYGTGIRGAEAKRLAESKDSRIKNRISFYVDEGKGVFPEGGVGVFKHEVTLTNMYDGAKNPLKLDASDPNAFESAVIDAGFDGYYVREGFGRQGTAVLLGQAADSVQVDLPPESQTLMQGDPLYNRALITIREKGSTSIPALVRNLGIPYGRAESLIKQLEMDGYIVPAEGAHRVGRDVAATPTAALGQYDVTDKINVAPVFYQSGVPDITTPKPAFYSVLTQTIEAHSQKKGTPDQWIGILKNLTQKGVKTEELELSGVLDFLEQRKTEADHWHVVQDGGVIVSRPVDLGKPPALEGAEVRLYEPSKSVTREEIADFLKAHAVIIRPKVYGYDANNPNATTTTELDFSFGQWEIEEPDMVYLEQNAIDRINDMTKVELSEELSRDYQEDPQQSLIEGPTKLIFDPEIDALYDYIRDQDVEVTEEVKTLYDAMVEAQTTTEKDYYYSDSDSPQLLSVSVDVGNKLLEFQVSYGHGDAIVYDLARHKEVPASFRDFPDEAELESTITGYLEDEYGITTGGDNAPKFEDYVLPDGDRYRERLLVSDNRGDAPAFEYTSHFDDENIIAHTRVTDRLVPVEALAANFPDLAKKLRGENREAKVYYLEELQSDWAQQGRAKKPRSVYYAPEELTVDMAASAGNEQMHARLEVAEVADDEGRTLFYVSDLVSGERIGRGFESKQGAERNLLQLVAADKWIVKATDGQVFSVLKSDYPTPEEVVKYIAETKRHSVDSNMTAFEIARERAKIEKRMDALHSQGIEERKANGQSEAYLEIRNRESELQSELASFPRTDIPGGAFVESTDAWVALAMKDAIREAAAGGYDLIAWTTGDQQTKRWSGGLRQQVDEIEWTKSAEGVIHVLARKGTRVVADTKYGENDLSAAIGKTMAKRIIEDPNQTGKLQGDDIVVADLGMTKFYGDQAGLNPDGKPAIMAKVANKVLSKIGGEKVQGLGENAELTPSEKELQALNKATWSGTPLTQEQSERKAELNNNGTAKALQRKLKKTGDTVFGAQPAFEITTKMKEIVLGEGQALFQPNRGSFNPSTLTISMLKDADLSTVLHETGHAFLEMDMARASAPDAPQRVKDRMAATLRWFGVADINAWNAMTLEQKRPYHEKFARGFESYLFEGKAPSTALQSAFASFRSWLKHIYRSLLNLNVELTPEVRQVFDRMLATDAQIAEAQDARNYGELALEGLSDSEKKTYTEQGKAATQESVDELEKRSLRDMKWLSNAKAAVLKKLQQQAEAKRRAIHAEVTAEVMAEPINQARTWLRKGEMVDPVSGDAVKADKGFRLDNAELATMYPETMLSRPDITALRGMTMNDGLPPDVVADMFGFRSGDQLVRELISGEDPKTKIDGLTDSRMLEENGDLVDERAVQEAADRAVHNEARARFIATGLKALTKSPLSSYQLAKAATATAKEVIAAKKVRDLKPAQYTSAETKANREALKEVAKDPAKAQRAQRSALLNNRLAAASLDALEEVRKGVDHLNKVQKKAAQSNMRGEYLTQLNALLDRFDLRTSVTLKSLDIQRTPLAEWVQSEADRLSAVVPDIAGWIQNEGNATHYKNLTVEEFRGVVDAVKSLELMARREEKQYQAIRGMKFAEERTAILDRIREFHPEAFGLDGEPLGMSPKFVKNLGDTVASLGEKAAAEFLNAETIIGLLEGGEFGVVSESLFGRMSNRADWKAQRMHQIQEQLKPLFEAYSLKERYDFGRKDIAAEIGMSLTRENALVVALLHGNAEGRERLANYGWSLATQQSIVDLLDAKDVELAKGIWQLFDQQLWPELKALNDRTRGKSPPKVEALEVQTKHGKVSGGYFRLKYDSNLDERAHRLDEGAAVKELLGGGLGMSAKTAQGSSTERKANVTMRPRLDLGVFAEAVTETVHDLAFRESVADTMRMLNDTKVQNTIKTAAGTPAYRALVNRVREIAAPPRNPAGFIEKTLTVARRNTIITLMSGVNTALQNFTGLASAYSGDRVNPGRLTKEIALFYSPKMAERYQFAMDNSEYMKGRHNSFERDLQNQVKSLTVDANVMPEMGTWLVLMGLVDKGTSVPVWNAAFDEGMARFENDHKKAVDYADHTVRQTLGSGREIDISQIMGGHGGWGQLKKTFTMFQSYFNGQLGQLVRSGAINKRLARTNPGLATARFTRDFMLVYVVPMVLTKMLFSPPDKEPEEWARNYTRAFAQYGMAMVPLWGSMMNSLWAAFDPTARNYGYKITPVESGVEGIIKGAKSVADVAAGEGDDRDFKNIIMGTGFAVGLPGKLVADTALGTKAFLEEEAGPMAILQGPPRK